MLSTPQSIDAAMEYLLSKKRNDELIVSLIIAYWSLRRLMNENP